VLSKLVETGRKVMPQIHCIYGVPGVGKSTFASKFPEPIFIDLEKGSYALDVARVSDVPTLEKFREVLQLILTDNHSHKTIVIDSIESLEGLLSDFVCKEGKVDSIEKYDGGFGKGFSRLREIGREIMIELRALAEKRGMTVVMIGHSQVRSQTDPATNASYDRYTLRTNEKFAAVIRDLSDNVFFVTHKVYTAKENNKTKAVSDGERVLFTEWRAGFDAKNRLSLPFEIPLDYQAFVAACEGAAPKSASDLRKDIEELIKGLDNEELKTKVKAALEKNPSEETLHTIKNRVLTYVQI
jgi:hypothetical protein